MSVLSAPRAASDRVAIRVATPADARALEAIEAASFTHDHLSPRALARHLRSASADVFAAVLAREIVGYCLVFYRAGSTIARLYSIATAPAARGRGAGRRLMETCEHAARRRGCDRLRLEVHEKNAAAIALYEKFGYRRIRRCEDYYQDGATALRLEKRLVSP